MIYSFGPAPPHDNIVSYSMVINSIRWNLSPKTIPKKLQPNSIQVVFLDSNVCDILLYTIAFLVRASMND